MPPYTLAAPCTPADARGLAENNMSAFWQEAWYRINWPDRTLAYQIDVVEGRVPQNILKSRETMRHLKMVDAATGQIVGYARWIMPAECAGEWLEAQTEEIQDKEEMRRYVEAYSNSDWCPSSSGDGLDDHIQGMRDRHRPRRPHMSLDYLGVHPDHQHHGIGTRLVAAGVEKAQQLGLDIMLVAMGAKAKKTYVKNGFQICEEHSQSLRPWGADENYDTALMVWRHPTGQTVTVTAAEA